MSAALKRLRVWVAKTKLAKSYLNVFRIVSKYWRAYGGWGDLFASVYLHAAVLICALSYGFWTVAGWWDFVISVVPSLLGFTLGGYALLVGFLGEKFRRVISGPKVLPDGETSDSTFIVVNATFVHYIVVQMLALISASLAKTCHGTSEHSLLALFASILHVSTTTLGNVAIVLWGIGFLLFAYAMTLSASAAFAVFRIGTWLDKHENDGLGEETTAAKQSTNMQPAPRGVRVASTAQPPATDDIQAETDAAEAKSTHKRKN